MSITGIVFLFGFLLGVILAFVRHPIWGLYTYVAVYYLDPYSRWWATTLPELRWSLIIAAVTLISTIFARREERVSWLGHGPVWVIVFYVVWVWIQSLWAITGADHSYGIEILTKYLVVIYLVYTLVNTRERLNTFLFAHVIGCFYLSFIAWTSFEGGRLDGVGGPGINDSNSLGMQLGTAVLCAGALYLVSQNWQKWISAASIPFLLNAIIMTGSRGAFLSLVAGALAMFWMRPPKQLRKVAAYIVVGGMAFGYLASDYFWERIVTLETAVSNIEEADQSAASRIEVIKAQFEMVKRYPFGTGHKGTAWLSEEYLDEEHMSSSGGRSSHNSIMSALVDQGIPGLLMWLLLMLLVALRSFRLRTLLKSSADIEMGWVNASLFGALAVYWTAGMFAPLLKAEIYMWLIACICACGTLTGPRNVEATSEVRSAY